MNLQQLVYFRTVAKYLHFTNAAQKLHVTQSSLSHSISDLERELGAQLFTRHSRGVTLSKFGQIYLSYVEDSLDVLDAGRRRIEEELHTKDSVIALAYLSSLEQFISELTLKYLSVPENEDDIFHFAMRPNTGIESALVDGLVDIAICNKLNTAGLDSIRIGPQSLVVAVSELHPLANRGRIALSELSQENFVMYAYEFRIRKYIDVALNQLNIQPKIIQETTHGAIMLKSVRSGHGIALLPEPLEKNIPGIKFLAIENALPPWDVFLYWKNARYISPSVEKFIQFVKSEGLVFEKYKQQGFI